MMSMQAAAGGPDARVSIATPAHAPAALATLSMAPAAAPVFESLVPAASGSNPATSAGTLAAVPLLHVPSGAASGSH